MRDRFSGINRLPNLITRHRTNTVRPDRSQIATEEASNTDDALRDPFRDSSRQSELNSRLQRNDIVRRGMREVWKPIPGSLACDNATIKRRPSEVSPSLPPKRPRTTQEQSAINKTSTTSTSTLGLIDNTSRATSTKARDRRAATPYHKLGKRYTIEVPGLSDLESSSDSEAEDNDGHGENST